MQELTGTPADPTLEFVELTLKGTTYRLCFDFEAMARAEEETGLSLILGLDYKALRITQIRGLFRAAALKAHPDLTLAETTKLVTPVTASRIAAAVMAAWLKTLAESEGDSENPPGPKA